MELQKHIFNLSWKLLKLNQSSFFFGGDKDYTNIPKLNPSRFFFEKRLTYPKLNPSSFFWGEGKDPSTPKSTRQVAFVVKKDSHTHKRDQTLNKPALQKCLSICPKIADTQTQPIELFLGEDSPTPNSTPRAFLFWGEERLYLLT